MQYVLIILSSNGWVEDYIVNRLDQLQLNDTFNYQETEQGLFWRLNCGWSLRKKKTQKTLRISNF